MFGFGKIKGKCEKNKITRKSIRKEKINLKSINYF